MSKRSILYGLGAVCCVVAISFVTLTNRQTRRKEITLARRQPVQLHHRRIYAYSVISGGVESGVELRKVLLTDSVAAEHYSDFHVGQARVITLDSPRHVFVSYRKDNRVYWTRSRLTVPKGETILTDGSLSARTRCGNQLSDTPKLPVLARDEPSQKELDEIAEPDSALTRWSGESWQQTDTQAPGESSGTGDSTAKDYQSSFGPDLGSSIARTGGNFGGGGGSSPGGGSPGQSGSTGSKTSTSGTAGGVNGSVNPMSGIINVPLVPYLPSVPTLLQVVNPPLTVGSTSGGAASGSSGGTSSGTTKQPVPVGSLWSPIPYSFPYAPPTVLAVLYPPVGVAPTPTSPGLGIFNSERSTSAVVYLEGSPPGYATQNNVPTAESPEPDTLGLILAAGILACVSGGVRRRIRSRERLPL